MNFAFRGTAIAHEKKEVFNFFLFDDMHEKLLNFFCPFE